MCDSSGGTKIIRCNAILVNYYLYIIIISVPITSDKILVSKGTINLPLIN